MEAVHLAASGHLLNLLIDKFFEMPYLSLVRYADHIACQRVEMMSEPVANRTTSDDGGVLNGSGEGLITEQHMASLNKFFTEFKYSFRHKRLVCLLEQLKASTSSSGWEATDQQEELEGRFSDC